jgi:hypothetical protein
MLKRLCACLVGAAIRHHRHSSGWVVLASGLDTESLATTHTSHGNLHGSVARHRGCLHQPCIRRGISIDVIFMVLVGDHGNHEED